MEPLFISLTPGALGRRMCLWHAPASPAADSVNQCPALIVHVHAFAEEMNKSRRMSALQSRALAASGHAVLQFDLLGCGDSAGEFSDATWLGWVGDVVAAAQWAQQRFAAQQPESMSPALWLWGHRAGCLLAAEAIGHLSGPWSLLFWQPALKGNVVLQQFLRLETAGALFGKSAGTDKPSAKATLAAGACAQIAGYGLSPALAQGLEASRLVGPTQTQPQRLEWIDVGQQSGADPGPAAVPVLQAWASAGWAARHHSVAGPSFWQTTEIKEAPQLIAATLAALLPPDAGAGGVIDAALRPALESLV